MKNRMSLLAVVFLAAHAPAALAQDDDVVMKALTDELGRSMTLQLEGLQSPYFLQYAVSDVQSHRISATCGAIVNSDDAQSRRLSAAVRVGYYDLDNTNFAGGGGMMGGRRGRGGGGMRAGGAIVLPTEDNYTAIRRAAWLATDPSYKAAVETLAQKQAYMEDRNLPDRPDDFARAEPVVSVDPKVALDLDVDGWERKLRRLSARFLDYDHILDSQVSLSGSAENRYLLNTEGTRVRKGVESVVLTITASAQAEDGEQLSDRITHEAATADDLPGADELLAEIDVMAVRLAGRVQAEVLENYLGPVLFDGRAAPQLFRSMLASGVAGTPEPVGGGRRRFAGMASLDKYLDKRILPRDFNVYDDPTAISFDDLYLSGHYLIDDEGVPAQRVDIVIDGRLKNMVMSRSPTDDFDASNGHGRSAGLGNARAAIGCLFVESADGLPEDELKEALIEAIEDQELEYGLRVTSIGGGGGGGGARQAMMRMPGQFQRGGAGGGGTLADPVAIYKVYPDGREELVRGCEFGSLDVGTLKDIIAAGKDPIVHNTGGSTSVVAPAVLFEEVELFTIEEERQTLPIVEAPHRRKTREG
jgi:hypothetical protein